MPNPGDIYYALDTNKTYVTVNGQWVLQSPEFTGDVNIAQSTTTTTLINTGVVAGVYGGTTNIPVITVDSKGRITAASTASIYNGPALAGGPLTAVQFNDAGVLGGVSTFTYDSIADSLNFTDAYVSGTMTFVSPQPTFNNLSPLTTKGDLLVYDAITNSRLPVGTDGQVLMADSAEALGVKWTTITASGTNVPYYVPPATTYLLPEYYQANFILPIEVDGDIEIDGYLIELANQ